MRMIVDCSGQGWELLPFIFLLIWQPSGLAMESYQVVGNSSDTEAVADNVTGDLEWQRYLESSQFIEDTREKLKALQALAEAGNPNAMCDLGHELHYAPDSLKDDRAAIAWLMRAAEHGLVDAEFELGRSLGKSLGSEIGYKPEDGFQWAMKAASHGHRMSIKDVAASYGSGSGVGRDVQKSVYWLKRAMDTGWVGCGFDLSKYYAEGGIAGFQPVEQMKWFLVPVYMFSARSNWYMPNNPHLTEELRKMRTRMTAAQVEEAEEGARRWIAEHPFGPTHDVQ